MKSLDTETTGVDLHHGAKPYIITTCNEESEQVIWEWDVDPFTREPIVPDGDLAEIEEELRDHDLILQNPKFDFKALVTLEGINGWQWEAWDWKRIYCTLLAGHLLASNQPHDLTTMALVYLGVNIQPFEDRIQQATVEARRLARQKWFVEKHGEWRLAKEGLPEMPSAKGKEKKKRARGEDKDSVWKFDMWLPRAIAKAEGYVKGACEVVNLRQSQFDVRIDRTTKWGNPFVIGRDGNRAEVIEKYRRRLRVNPQLLEALPELDGKRLGCFCKPDDCHGDVLREELSKLAHPWWILASEYALADTAVTLPLFKAQEKLLDERGLWEIYEARLDLPEIIYSMERVGLAVDRGRKQKLVTEFTEIAEKCHRVCVNVADGEIESLPVNGTSNALKHVIFEKFNLKTERKTDTGQMSLDKYVLEDWIAELKPNTRPHLFVKNLRAYRKRMTALGYLKSYDKFGLDDDYHEAVMRLYPSLNPTGTDTLRFSSYGPNEQQISKQEETNLRYAFGPAPDREWWSLDAKNIELRLPAYEAGETEMIELFERPNDPPYFGSYHLLVFDTLHPEKFAQHGKKCKDIYESTWYQWTKNGNFAVQYGAVEASGTADKAYHVPGAQRRIQSRFSRIAKLNEAQIAFATKYGYVETIPDRTVNPKRGYPLLCSRTKWGGILPTVPLNYHIQGSAMWWMSKAMSRCFNCLRKYSNHHLVMQVHDELVFDFPRGKGDEPWRTNYPIIQRIKSLMEEGGNDIGIPTPVSCKYHPVCWSEGLAV